MTGLDSYKKQYEQLARHMEAGRPLQEEQWLNSFTFFSANIHHFLPLLPYAQHLPMYGRLRFHQWLNGLDAQFFADTYPLEIKGWEPYERRIRQEPGIICTYHFGAYQLINYLLVKARIPYVLLVGGEVTAQWQHLYPTLQEQLREAERAGRFLLLNASENRSLRRVKQLTEEGYHLLLYVDGMEGLEGQGSLEQLPFLGQHIAVPRGAAHLSHWLQRPLYPFVALRRGWAVELLAAPAICPPPGMDRRAYTGAAMGKLYDLLVPYLLHWPEQWTNWPQLHRLMRDGPLIGGERWYSATAEGLTDAATHGIYRVRDACFLLRKADYRSFRLSRADFDALYQAWYTS
ncbi:hypothetical protein [Olivibacter sitiensis]|uniref:hypothetical protein n=1 Tax=Olivibacter sitiensis TaxID=376470 RepID=UPI00040016CE|nr:hypothetical protein [Olivibacter sitiensis]